MAMVRNLLPPKPEEKDRQGSPQPQDGRVLPDPKTVHPKGKEDGLPPDTDGLPGEDDFSTENPPRPPTDRE
jgi:hypothetical protein